MEENQEQEYVEDINKTSIYEVEKVYEEVFKK
jgi:hypothetical protein